MKKHILLLLTFIVSVGYANAQNNVNIASYVQVGEEEGWIHIKLSDTLSNQVFYDSLVTIVPLDTFTTQLNLSSSIFKCEVLDISENVIMPIIHLTADSIAAFSYPEYEYYLFQLPVE